MVYFLISIIYYKIKLHTIRVKVQQEGLINNDLNITSLTLWSVIVWILPMTKFYDLQIIEHNKIARRINYSILSFVILLMIFGAYFMI